MILTGTPPAITSAGTSLLTMEPFAMTELFPIETPFKTVTRDPIKTFSPIETPATN